MRPPQTGAHQHGGPYEIRLDGHLERRWSASFDGLTLTCEDDGTTTLRGHVPDQAALYGVLRTLQDLGLALVSVTRLGTSPLAGACSQPAASPHPTKEPHA